MEEWATGPWTWHRVYTEKKQVASEWSVTHSEHLQTKDSKLDFAKLDSRVAVPLTDPMYQAVNYTSGVDSRWQGRHLRRPGVGLCQRDRPAQRMPAR